MLECQALHGSQRASKFGNGDFPPVLTANLSGLHKDAPEKFGFEFLVLDEPAFGPEVQALGLRKPFERLKADARPMIATGLAQQIREIGRWAIFKTLSHDDILDGQPSLDFAVSFR